ncbi:MAG TPA: hypothetical protein VKS03_00735 [Thermoanaerobaculia bacterium]|nr:hypothetical protein [Thermoanaerobaculia bacterium]
MFRSIRHAARLGPLVALAAAGLTRVAAGEEGALPRLAIRIYDSTGASRESIDAAGQETVRILSDAGIGAIWIDCSGDRFDPGAETTCSRPAGPLDVVFKILPHPGEAQGHSRETTAFSVVPNDGTPGVLAGVFLDRVLLIGWFARTRTFQIVGLLAAHEIGHLLLGTNSHSHAGIMRSELSDKTLRGASWGHLRFSRSEANRMRDALRRRQATLD